MELPPVAQGQGHRVLKTQLSLSNVRLEFIDCFTRLERAIQVSFCRSIQTYLGEITPYMHFWRLSRQTACRAGVSTCSNMSTGAGDLHHFNPSSHPLTRPHPCLLPPVLGVIVVLRLEAGNEVSVLHLEVAQYTPCLPSHGGPPILYWRTGRGNSPCLPLPGSPPVLYRRTTRCNTQCPPLPGSPSGLYWRTAMCNTPSLPCLVVLQYCTGGLPGLTLPALPHLVVLQYCTGGLPCVTLPSFLAWKSSSTVVEDYQV